jgi:hypothetical protein
MDAAENKHVASQSFSGEVLVTDPSSLLVENH